MEVQEEKEKLLVKESDTNQPTSDGFFIRGLNYIGKKAQNATNYLSRTTRKVRDRFKKEVFGQFSDEDMKKIKKEFLLQTLEARKKIKNDSQFGTMPTIVLPTEHIKGVAGAIKDTNGMFTFLQFGDNVSKGVSASAAVTVGVSVAVGSAIAMPPLLCIPLVVCLAAFLQFQKTKNKELLYASELIFSMCQDMLPDLIKMNYFYTTVKGVDTNTFIQKTLNKITELQVYIISLCEPIVIDFMALSFGIIDDFDKKTVFDDKKLEQIFGYQGFKDECHLLEDERTKTVDGNNMKDEQCDGNSSERSFASVKRAIIHRLTNTYYTRQASNFFASSEKYRQAIRDITIVGILFSQASARFSIDAINNIQPFLEAKTTFDNSDDPQQSKILSNVASNQGGELDSIIDKLNDDETDHSTVSNSPDGSTGGRRRKRTRKYRR